MVVDSQKLLDALCHFLRVTPHAEESGALRCDMPDGQELHMALVPGGEEWAYRCAHLLDAFHGPVFIYARDQMQCARRAQLNASARRLASGLGLHLTNTTLRALRALLERYTARYTPAMDIMRQAQRVRRDSERGLPPLRVPKIEYID